jgi:hypothetical protein
VLQLECLLSCNWSARWVATVLPLQLQSDTCSSCNRCTLRVASTKCFRLILYYPSVATGQWFELQSMYTPSCKYRALPPDTVLHLQLQPDSGSSCNWYTLWVANIKHFHLIVYHPFPHWGLAWLARPAHPWFNAPPTSRWPAGLDPIPRWRSASCGCTTVGGRMSSLAQRLRLGAARDGDVSETDNRGRAAPLPHATAGACLHARRRSPLHNPPCHTLTITVRWWFAIKNSVHKSNIIKLNILSPDICITPSVATL